MKQDLNQIRHLVAVQLVHAVPDTQEGLSTAHNLSRPTTYLDRQLNTVRRRTAAQQPTIMPLQLVWALARVRVLHITHKNHTPVIDTTRITRTRIQGFSDPCVASGMEQATGVPRS